MSLLLLLLLLLHLSNCVSAKQSGLEDSVRDDPEKMTYKSEKLHGIDKKVDQLLQRMERMDISWKKETANLEK